jgi:hypothetical protein
MRFLGSFLLVVVVACAHRAPDDSAQTAAAGELPATREPQTAPSAGPQSAGPAAAPAPAGSPVASPTQPIARETPPGTDGGMSADAGSGLRGARDRTAEDNSCAGDEECTLTRVPEGGCCPQLCAPRAVAVRVARKLRRGMSRCEGGRHCVMPMCRMMQAVEAACIESRCQSRPSRAGAE